jgi:hypothetical protein
MRLFYGVTILLTLCAHAETLPMRTVDGLPAAVVAIGGEKATFIIDVDANLIAIAPSLVQRLGLKPRGDTVRLPSLRLGTHELRDVEALVDPFLDRVHHDGVLGTPAYDRVLLTLDYPASRIRIDEGSLKSGLACAPEFPDRCAIPITLAGEPRLAIIDTAAKRPLLIPRDIAATLRLREKQRGIAAGPQTGNAAVEDATLDGDVVIAGHRVASPAITIHDRPRILIGSGLLRRFVVTFDLHNRRVLIATAPAPPRT